MLRINPVTCLRWVNDHYGIACTDPETKLRFKECLKCGNAKGAVSFNATFQVAHCFRCGANVPFLELVKIHTGITNDLEVIRHLKTYGTLSFHWQIPGTNTDDYKSVLTSMLRDVVYKTKGATGGIDLSDFSTDWNACRAGQFIRAYGAKRGIPDALLDSGRMGYYRKGNLSGRLIALVFESGVPVFAVGRAIRPEVQPKYLYPNANDCGGRGASHVLYNLDLIPDGSIIPVAEGYISAISAGPNCTAMLGNTLSEIQAAKLRAKNPSAVIILREEGIDPAHSEASAMKLWAKGTPAFVADLVNGDPNDNPEQMPGVLNAARETNEFSYLSAKLANIS